MEHSTPQKSEHRDESSARSRMVRAAARLLIDNGPSAITHRRVAEAAGVPVGSANYFFPTRKGLYAFAVEAAESLRLEAAQGLVAAVPPATRTPAETAHLLIQTWYAPHVGRDVVRARLEPMIDALHEPELRDIMSRSRPKLLQVLRELLEKSGFGGVTDVDLVALVLDGSLLYEHDLDETTVLESAEDSLSRLLRLVAGEPPRARE
ncbi:TetR family transcriptional regulator [Leucobacter insecticola]|uniref:TetR family transcriptional regulator n=1 Tax=Leucobacter insecticola TaxID=2714934 RepID=A0A6G8FFW3_9MICO|nr:TetR family transcriptional regulator [Leucobacter insecticola]QIM15396.1 TetR family transcriptional regulator [Leucobacter insecticola]